MGLFKRPEGITCVIWEPLENNGKRCRLYQVSNDGMTGLCLDPSNFLCSEWVKANPGVNPTVQNRSSSERSDPTTVGTTQSLGPRATPPPPPTASSVTATSPGSSATEGPRRALGGAELPPQPDGRKRLSLVHQGLSNQAAPGDPVPSELVRAAEAGGLRASLDLGPAGRVRLVRASPGPGEMTHLEAAYVAMLLTAFPGSSLVSFNREHCDQDESLE